MIVELARAGMRVGVTAVSHRVIRNLLDKALSAVAQEGVPLEAVHKVRKRSGETREGLHEEIGNAGGRQSLDAGRLLSGTAWLWARDDMVESVDHLFIDCLDGTTLERDIPVRGLAPATAAPPPAR